VEITSEVADSNQSVILNQVENGTLRMAVIYLLASKFNKWWKDIIVIILKIK
jgi:aspartate carbamoyltransferase catalytic subunit